MSDSPRRGLSGGEILKMAAEHRRGLHMRQNPECSLCHELQLEPIPIEGDLVTEAVSQAEAT
jgi:hypothetical protein